MKTAKFVAFVALLSIVASASAFAQAADLGTKTSGTPYDRYLGRVHETLGSLHDHTPPLTEVKQYIKTGRAFRYYMKDPYIPQTPQETEATKKGDCKAKSLWVAYKMDDESLRFVVGKVRSVRNMSHAWLLWKGPDGWLILDATMFDRPLDCARLGPKEFTPLYSYTANGKYVHTGVTATKTKEAKYGDHD